MRRALSAAATRLSRDDGATQESDYQRLEVPRVDVIRPRRVGAEHVALEALRRLGLDVKLAELGLNRHQLHAAIGVIVWLMARIVAASWRRTNGCNSAVALGRLDYDFSGLDLRRLYRGVTDY